jgi:hypothetical protein
MRPQAARAFLRHALNLIAPCRDPARGIVLGATLGIGAEFAWVEIFKTTSFEGYSGMLVFFTFMPLGAMIGVRAVGLSGQRNRDRTRARPAPGPVNILNRPS